METYIIDCNVDKNYYYIVNTKTRSVIKIAKSCNKLENVIDYIKERNGYIERIIKERGVLL